MYAVRCVVCVLLLLFPFLPYNCEVIAVSGNVGQADELEGLEEKALKTGASKLYVLDLTDEYVDDYII
ncbi:MAG: argininosuccinate synthase, partial [Ruminococcus sp.]|nr:argininosuccinate synthase [Ruminococcus sp.]